MADDKKKANQEQDTTIQESTTTFTASTPTSKSTKITNSNGFNYPTPSSTNVRRCTNYAFGPSPNGATTMSIYFLDGRTHFCMTTSKYFDLCKQIERAEQVKNNYILFPLKSLQQENGFENKFVWSYVKVIIVPGSENSGSTDENSTRIMFCELVCHGTNFNTFDTDQNWGIICDFKLFKDISTKIYSNKHLVKNIEKPDF